MAQHSHSHLGDSWSGWSTISAEKTTSFTVWLTGLPGSGKATLAQIVKQALTVRGYKVEIIDSQALAYWLKQELHIDDVLEEERSHAPGYDAFVTYICMLLARNGIITIPVSVSPYQEARRHARQQIGHFIEVYVHCPTQLRYRRLYQQEVTVDLPADVYQPPDKAEIAIDTSCEPPERSALRILSYLEEHGYVAPRWEEHEIFSDEELATVKARLQALGYLD